MNQIFLTCLCCLLVTGVSGTAQVLELYRFTSATPTKVNDVEDGSNLYLSSTDAPDILAKISITSNGKTYTLQTLPNNLDANGFTIGFPVKSDLTISTTNSAKDTDALNGVIFISNAAMAKDPNFLVYLVSDQVKTIDRSNSQDTTLMVFNRRVERQATDPVGKPYYYSRLENIVQEKTSTVLMYQGIPTEQYSDPTYKAASTLIFRNPMAFVESFNMDEDTMFFPNVEPIQYTLRSYHIRALGPVKFTVSQDWKDLSTYMTTNETTTGYMMSQKGVDRATVDFQYTPNHDGKFGFMITTSDLAADLNVTSCGSMKCYTEAFSKSMPVATDLFQKDRNDTSLYINPANTDSGFFYLQYFRIESGVSVPGESTSTAATTEKAPETTTRLGAVNSVFVSILSTFVVLCWI